MSTERVGVRAVSIKKMVSMPPYRDLFTEAAIRALIFYAGPRYNSRGECMPGNGLLEAGAVMRIGRRVLIDLSRFDEWLESKRDIGKVA